MKYSHATGAEAGSYTPFLVGPKEIVLTSVSLRHIAPGDRVTLRVEIEWRKPIHWDTGDMEVYIREGSPTGEPVYYSIESCFVRARLRDRIVLTGRAPGAQIFYLTVRSAELRAYVSGRYALSGAVEAP